MNLFGAILLGCFAFGTSKACYAQVESWNNSPYNWKNSEYNSNNNSSNWDNSPYNWKNSPENYDSRNGLYGSNGERVGYEVVSPQGVTNYFDNNGNRLGYAIKKGRY